MTDRDFVYPESRRMQIANTILHQMGGSGRLQAMIDIHDLTLLSDNELGLSFKFRGSREANICKVLYNVGRDTYTFSLYKYTSVRYAHCPRMYYVEDIYFDMLIEIFERNTGLSLHL